MDVYDGAGDTPITDEKKERKLLLMKSRRPKSMEATDVDEALESSEVLENNSELKKVISLMNDEGKVGHRPSNNGGDLIGSKPMFRDLGGMRDLIEELKMEFIVPLYNPQLPNLLGINHMAGILLHGPPGCGKTMLAHAIANETGLPFYPISATDLVSGVSGAPEQSIEELFSKANQTAPSIVFIDEIDAIASKRGSIQREMKLRILTRLMTCMDESHRLSDSNQKAGYVLVIGATNSLDDVDSALRRPGRFDREIVLGVPDEQSRFEILSVLMRNLKVDGAFDLAKIARSTSGFVGADLAALTNKTCNLAMKRIIEERKKSISSETTDRICSKDWWRQPWTNEVMEKLSVTMADVEEAAKMVQPSSRREGFSDIPNVTWDDVGGLHLVKEDFDRYIVRRIKFPKDYEDFGVDLETAFLLYGPPGCGKTLIVQALANEAGSNFIHIKGTQILSQFVGESELSVRTIFSRARTCSPCILFFDEVDALTTMRGEDRLLSQLLVELDGAEPRHGVYVIGATNRLEAMDNALLRPGRFGKLMHVALPSPNERGMILKVLARNKPIEADLLALGKESAFDNLSGADLSSLMDEANLVALEEKLSLKDVSCTIKDVHFKIALEKTRKRKDD